MKYPRIDCKMQPTIDLTIIKEIKASREQVWQAWTNPDQLKNWWGPAGFTTTYFALDLRVGGKYLYCIKSPDGNETWSTGSVLEIVEGKKFVITDSFADKEGNIVSASTYGVVEELPEIMVIDLTLDGDDVKTLITLKHIGVPDTGHKEQMEQGWNQFLERLANILE